jgi:hypothetical protein
MYTGMLAEERDKRGQYVVQLLNEMSSTHPHKNVLIINQSCRHRRDFSGTTTERSASFDAGEALGYGAGRDERLVTHFKCYAFDDGEFTLEDDGGYCNWAFNGNFQRGGRDNKHVVFKRR